MARFFIDRPVFAWVIAISIMLAGLLAYRTLPLEQYPDIAPPTITVTSVYPGASAKAVEDSVTQVIEQQMTGLDGLDYMSSTSSSTGIGTTTLTFESGVDPDVAQVQVQNKLSLATPQLPQAVQQQGLTVAKASSGFLMVVALSSPDGRYDQFDLGDYIDSNFIDQVNRVPGVGNSQLFGSGYAMRIWLKPDKLEQFGLMPSDVINAISAQNAQVSAGSLGDAPTPADQEFTATVTLQSLMQTPEQFRNLEISTSASGRTLTLSEVADVEIGAESYAVTATFNGNPSSGFAVNLAAGANAIETADGVRELMNELSKNLPEGMKVEIPYDTTPFVEASIHEVQKTIIEATILVFIVIFVFLQSLRATFVPMIAIPVVLLGTLAVMAVAGFSLNMLTMFAMILAIGLLVDDAIVVVENVERVMEEDGLGPREAAKKSMDQITGALIGIVVVISAVFVPMAFFPGSTGVIYRQFSVTIVSAMVLSVIVAIVLAPAICASFLKPKSEHRTLIHKPGDIFNRGFDRFKDGYAKVVSRILARRWIFMGVFAIIVAVLGVAFQNLPTSFLPEEDQGSLFAMAQLPGDASQARTKNVMAGLADHVMTTESENITGIFAVSGFSFAAQGANQGASFIALKDWEERADPLQSSASIAMRTSMAMGANPDGMVFAFTPPAMPALGNASGFNLYLKDDTNLGHDALIDARNALLGQAGQNSSLMGVRPNGREDGPQYNLNIDYRKAQALGVQPSDIASVLSTAMGSNYVNDFLDRGRIKRVIVQGENDARMQPSDISKWRVRNASGDMIAVEEVLNAQWGFGSPQLERYNGVSAVNIQGSAAPGQSSGEAMLEMENIINTLPAGIGFEWTGISAEERKAGNQAVLLYAMSILFIFLCLAALYESWTIPVAVLLAAPLGVAGAVAAAHFRGLANDVFFQVGVLTTVALASKNGILIVEFAKDLEEEGKELIEATMEAVRMRLRPILMTSFAFGLGVLPLALSTGAGAGARVAIGTAVVGGMIFATVLGIFFTPVFYVVMRFLTGKKTANQLEAQRLTLSQQEA
ncbi:MAG: efflux RND transporter permease subunit [Alphaproteobacteria bacterium]